MTTDSTKNWDISKSHVYVPLIDLLSFTSQKFVVSTPFLISTWLSLHLSNVKYCEMSLLFLSFKSFTVRLYRAKLRYYNSNLFWAANS